jgi:hypothetical protein
MIDNSNDINEKNISQSLFIKLIRSLYQFKELIDMYAIYFK